MSSVEYAVHDHIDDGDHKVVVIETLNGDGEFTDSSGSILMSAHTANAVLLLNIFTYFLKDGQSAWVARQSHSTELKISSYVAGTHKHISLHSSIHSDRVPGCWWTLYQVERGRDLIQIAVASTMFANDLYQALVAGELELGWFDGTYYHIS